MAYIAPNTVITFFKSTGLSTSYENTLYFASESEKNLYFANWSSTSGRQVGTSKQSYQRANRGYCRVEIGMNLMYDVDYMRFNNASFEDKVYYAFVTSVNYINNVTTEVEYVIDYLMTWMGNFTLGQCYVERQHVRNDSIGANICDEGLSTGPYIQEGLDFTDNYGKDKCKIRVQWTNPDEVATTTYGGVYDPTKSGDFSSADDATEQINILTELNLVDNIVNVYMVPSAFANPTGTNKELYKVSKPYSTIGGTADATSTGYTPKNKKLFTYPYKYLEVDNSEGSSKMFKYEYFNNLPDATSSGECEFTVGGNTVNRVELVIWPRNYNGRYSEDYSNGLSMTDFPTCAWATDIYKAYLAQKNAYFIHDYAQTVVQSGINNAGSVIRSMDATDRAVNEPTTSTALVPVPQTTPQITKAALSGASIGATIGSAVPGVGTATGALVGAGISVGLAGLSAIASNMIDNTIQPEAGSRISGQSAANVLFTNGAKRFTFHKMSITKNYAMMIDNYFTMFGYKIRQVLVPSMNVRPHWTYVKTVDCIVNGKMPAHDRSVIESLFNTGLRFWKSLDEMGNYSLDNSPS